MSIALRKEYITALDEVLKNASVTGNLTADPEVVKAGANAEEILIPKYDMDGLADYSKASGYVTGDVSLEYETVKCDFDRGRKFNIDTVDNMDTANVLYAKLAKEFIRTKVAPEMDAWRFAKLAGTSNIGTTDAAALSTGANVLAALRAANDALDDGEVPAEDRVLYITPALLGLVEDLDTTKSRAVLASFKEIRKVPQSRFYTKITQYDGTTSGQTAGGYIKDATNGKNINFMVVWEPAVISYSKHVGEKVFTPEENQATDGYLYCYRNVAMCRVKDNAVKGIYLHKSTT